MQIKLWIQQQKLKLQTLKRRQLVIGGMVGALLIVWGISVLLFSEKYIGTDKAAAEVQQLAENIRRFYQNRPDFLGIKHSGGFRQADCAAGDEQKRTANELFRQRGCRRQRNRGNDADAGVAQL